MLALTHQDEEPVYVHWALQVNMAICFYVTLIYDLIFSETYSISRYKNVRGRKVHIEFCTAGGDTIHGKEKFSTEKNQQLPDRYFLE